MKKLLVVFMLFCAFAVTSLPAQQYNLLERITASSYAIIEKGTEQNNKGLLMQARATLEQALSVQPENPCLLYAMAFTEYRILCTGFASGDDGLFGQFADSAIVHAEKAQSDPRFKSDASALLGSVYGMKIAKNWVQAPFLGPKSSHLLEEAVQSDSTNPRAWFFTGVSQFSTPEFFGGSKKKAAESFDRAIRCAESAAAGDSLLPHWGLLDAMIWRGRTAEAAGELTGAIAVYHRVLELAPEYGWVKYSLLPEAEKKLASSK